MRKAAAWLVLAVLMMMAVVGCGQEKYKPVAIKEGVDKCEVCQMLIKDDQYATQIILKDQKPLKFDDLGDLYVWLGKNGRDQVGAAYVRDFHTKEWVELDKATYVYNQAIKTPMSFGVVSFAKETDADKFIQEQGAGKKLTAKELDSHEWSSTMGGGHGSMGEGGHGSMK